MRRKLLEKIEILEARLVERNFKIQQLTDEKLNATNQYYACLKDIDQLRDQLFALRQEKLTVDLEGIVKGMSANDSSIYAVGNRVKSRLDEFEQCIKIQSIEHGTADGKIDSLIETLNSFINNQNTENMFNLKKLREREAEISVLKENAARLESTIADLRKNLEGSRANEEALKARLDQLGYAEQQIEKLTKQLNDKESENLALKDSVNTITDELERTKHKLISANGKQGSMAAKIKKLIERLSKYEPNPESDGSEREAD